MTKRRDEEMKSANCTIHFLSINSSKIKYEIDQEISVRYTVNNPQ